MCSPSLCNKWYNDIINNLITGTNNKIKNSKTMSKYSCPKTVPQKPVQALIPNASKKRTKSCKSPTYQQPLTCLLNIQIIWVVCLRALIQKILSLSEIWGLCFIYQSNLCIIQKFMMIILEKVFMQIFLFAFFTPLSIYNNQYIYCIYIQ